MLTIPNGPVHLKDWVPLAYPEGGVTIRAWRNTPPETNPPFKSTRMLSHNMIEQNPSPSNACFAPVNITKDNDITSSEYSDRHEDRPRGMFTDGDRQFLSPENDVEEMNDQTVRNRRYRIRKRIKNTIKDFEIFSKLVPSTDRESAIKDIAEENIDYLIEIGVLLYLEFDSVDIPKRKFLESVIEEGERRKGREVDATVASHKEDGETQVTIKTTPRSPPTKAD